MKLFGLFSSAGKAVGETIVASRERLSASTARVLNAFYDAAAPGGVDEEHWSIAGSLSARQVNAPSIRRTLRNRARYEVANNTLARGIVDTLADDLIGEGPRLQIKAGGDSGLTRQEAQQIEREFAAWADASRIWIKARTMRKARAHDGEIFAVRTANEKIDHPVKLDFSLIEAERVSNEYELDIDVLEVDGITYDAAGNPTTYRVLRYHPDDLPLRGNSNAFDVLAAENVVHYFRQDRPGQVRGIPEITPALPLFAKLRRMTSATLSAAETAAKIAKVIYTENPLDSEAGVDATPFDVVDLPENQAMVLPDGWKIGQVKAEHPTTTFPAFRREIAGEIGRCLSMPVNVVLGDSSQHNYASGKLDHQLYLKKLAVDRDELRVVFLDRVFRWWLEQAVLVEGLLPQSARRAMPPIRFSWTWPAREHADPSKEASAAQTRLEAGYSNLAIECARLGLDWQDVLDQRAEEVEYRRSLGLPEPTSSATPAAGRDAGNQTDQPDPEEAQR